MLNHYTRADQTTAPGPYPARQSLFYGPPQSNDLSFLLSSDIRSEGSIAIVKIFDFDFFMIFHSTSLPESKNVF